MKRTVERAKHVDLQYTDVFKRSHVKEFIKMETAFEVEDDNSYMSDPNEFKIQAQYNFKELSPVKSEEHLIYSQHTVQPKLDDICRLCLSENIVQPVSITSSMLHDNQTTVTQAIENLTNIEVNQLMY